MSNPLFLFTDIDEARKQAEDFKGIPFLSCFFPRVRWKPAYYSLICDRWSVVGRDAVVLAAETEGSDFFLFPYNYNKRLRDKELKLRKWVDHAGMHGRKLVVFSIGDEACQFDDARIIAFPTSLYRGAVAKSRSIIRAHPVFSNDIWKNELGRCPEFRRWSERPTVGFCGMTATDGSRELARYIRERLQLALHGRSSHTYLTGKYLRQKSMRTLQRSANSRYSCNFILRTTYLGPKSFEGTLAEARVEYLDNMLESDYTLCVKGGGNYSIRFFESAALGRIPLFVDTDCGLPCVEHISYRNLMPIVHSRDLKHLPEVLMQFHASHRNDFRDIQQQWIDISQQYYSPHGFHQSVVDYLLAIRKDLTTPSYGVSCD